MANSTASSGSVAVPWLLDASGSAQRRTFAKDFITLGVRMPTDFEPADSSLGNICVPQTSQGDCGNPRSLRQIAYNS